MPLNFVSFSFLALFLSKAAMGSVQWPLPFWYKVAWQILGVVCANFVGKLCHQLLSMTFLDLSSLAICSSYAGLILH